MTTEVKITSLEALEKYKEYFKETQEGQILSFIILHPNFTRNEISIDTSIQKASVCGRVKELLEKGLIEVGVSRLDSYNQTKVKAETLHLVNKPDWNLLDIKKAETIIKEEKTFKIPYKYAPLIKMLIESKEKSLNETQKQNFNIALENNDENAKMFLTLKSIVNNITKKYFN